MSLRFVKLTNIVLAGSLRTFFPGGKKVPE